MRPNTRPDTVTASEVAEWVFCPESWRLARTGHDPTNKPQREAGKAHHARKAAVEIAAGGPIAAGRTLIFSALVAFAALAAFWWLSR
jgi:hypothetical protein